MDQPATELCLQLREARRARGLTQAQLAQRVGCQQSAVSMMEAGRATALARETLVRIAAELGVVLEQTPERSAPAGAAPVSGAAHCTDSECPSNVPFVVSGVLVFWPRPQPVAGGRYCAYCGEVLARVCGKCGVPAGTGACCRDCGAPFVPPPAAIHADVEAWAETRRRQIAEWRALL
ncbi:MAG: helix-turn-helix transcriptional regulator [bacterium]